MDFAWSDFLLITQSPSSLGVIWIMVFFPSSNPLTVLVFVVFFVLFFIVMKAGKIFLKMLEAKMNPVFKNSQGSATVCGTGQKVSKQVLLLLQKCAWISRSVFSL